MKVFKFGGASVRDAEAVKNAGNILKKFPDQRLLVVVSAMDKTTNALEKVTEVAFKDYKSSALLLENIQKFHLKIIRDLFNGTNRQLEDTVNNFFAEAYWAAEHAHEKSFDFCYDQLVSVGELISSAILSAWLNHAGIKNSWLDARDYIITDDTWREGKVNWVETCQRMTSVFPQGEEDENLIAVTQGFIGSTPENYTTTLGREGSDYSAAIFAHCMGAECMMIWKDVPGVLNADPKFFREAQKLDKLSYHDAIELAYYGASVIHPKTIKPLENKNITLYVKSFLNPDAAGTEVGRDLATKPLIPSYIFKSNQMLISISSKDFSFIAEESLSRIFSLFAKHGVKINLMQNSAISFSVCADHDQKKTAALLTDLQQEFKVLYNDGLQLYTIRHYFPSTIEQLSAGKEVLIEQRSRQTAQLVMREKAV